MIFVESQTIIVSTPIVSACLFEYFLFHTRDKYVLMNYRLTKKAIYLSQSLFLLYKNLDYSSSTCPNDIQKLQAKYTLL
jgi:hypothetical protein